MEDKKSLFAPKESKEYLIGLEKKLSRLERYYDKDEYKGTKSIKNLFDLPIDKDFYKSIITKGAFNSNYKQYESMAGEDNTLSVEEYLHRIKPYLSDTINNHRPQGKKMENSFR